MKHELIYLASPYTHDDIRVMIERFDAVQKATVDLMNKGILCFSPIAYNHPMARKWELPTDWKFWEYFDKVFIDRVDALAILMLEGWEKSAGVAAEVEYAKLRKIPIYRIDPENPTELLEHE